MTPEPHPSLLRRSFLVAMAFVLVAVLVVSDPFGSTTPARAEVPSTTAVTLLSEGFEGPGLPAGWTETGGWVIAASTAGPTDSGIPSPHGGANFVVKEAANTVATLTSPPIDLTNATEPYVDFWLHSYDQSGIDVDPETHSIELSVLDAGGAVIDTVFAMGDTDLSGATGWTKFRVRLLDFVGQNVSLQFDFIPFAGNTRHDIGIDDLEVFDATGIVRTGLPSVPGVVFYTPVPASHIDDAHHNIIPTEQDCFGGAFGSINGNLVQHPVTTITSITIADDGTTILYDHIEDGHSSNRFRTQWSTEVWGDGDLTNGFPPGHPEDLLDAGELIILEERIDPDHSDTVLQYDAGDKFTSAEGLIVTRLGWSDGSSTLLAGATEVFDRSKYGNSFVIPIGEDSTIVGSAMEFVGASITSGADGNVVTLPDGSTVPLNKGESYFFDQGINEGDAITGTRSLTVQLLSGDVCSTFEGRWMSLLPINKWSDEYYTPVSSSSAATPTTVHLFNPGPGAITVDYEFGNGTTASIAVPPGETVDVVMPLNTGGKFASADGDFYATQTYDTGSTSRDWGLALLPITELSPVIQAGYAPGTDPTVDSATNTSPLWITAIYTGTGVATSVEVCVDYNGDSLPDPPAYDTTVTIANLASQKLKDPDNDNTGARIWVCNPADPADPALTDWVLAGAWGQENTAPGGSPSIDVGHGLLNLPSFDIEKGITNIDDDNGNSVIDVGDTVLYEIIVSNTGAIQIGRNALTVFDVLPSSVEYVPGTVVLTRPTGAVIPIPDNTVGPATTEFPLDLLENGTDVGVGYRWALNGFDAFTITFEASVLVVPTNNVVENVACVTDDRFTPCDSAVFEVVEFGSIGNIVWLDEDGDGVQDAGEDGVAGVEVTLTNLTTGEVFTTITDSDGGYLFTDLPIGDYSVAITPPAGMDPTYDEDGGFDNSTTVTLSPPIGSDGPAEHPTADFGLNWVPPENTDNNTGVGAIGDTVWADADGDGIQDPGEAGIGGVAVNLYDDPDGDGVYDTLVGTTTTDANGNYIFDDLPAGVYVVEVVPPAGATQTGDPDATLDNMTDPLVLAPGDVWLNGDFGYQPAVSNTIGDTVWLDGNADGVVDADEPGIPGVTVTLLDAAGNIVATTTTDTNGNYEFTGVPDGTYTVWVNDTDNVLQQFDPLSDPDGVADNQSTVTVAGGITDSDQDFGYGPPALDPEEGFIGDTVFLDLNGNGSPDPGEGIENVRLELYDSDGNLVGITWTNEYGQYGFGDLDEDEFTVVIDPSTLPAGLTQTIDPDGIADGESLVNLLASEQVFDQDFGYVADDPATISGTIWEDRDADGELDETGLGLAGITVALYDADGNLVATTVTDANGDYSFTGIPPGDYVVDVTDEDNLLAGWWHSDSDGGDGFSNDDPLSVTVPPGGTDVSADFGYYIDPGFVGNEVWEDANADGIRDPGEDPLVGVEVTLTIEYPDGTVLTVVTFTDANGEYEFPNLLHDEDYNGDPATAGVPEPIYTITVAPPPGYVSTYDGTPDATGIGNGTDDNADDESGEPAFPGQGEGDLTNDFGFYQLGAIGDFIWDDTNGDGVQDPGEPGLVGWDVTLTLPDGTTITQQTSDGTTDVDGDGIIDPPGSYYFGGLEAGDYDVTVTPAAGWAPTGDPDGVLDNTTSLTLDPGEINLDQDFGYGQPEIEIEKTVYTDHDAGVSCPGGELVTLPTGADVTYCFQVTNTGNVTLSDITIEDLDLGITEADMTLLSGTPASLAPDGTILWYFETTVDGDLLNTATVSGETPDGDPDDPDDDITDEDTAEVDEVTPGIAIDKTPDTQSVAYDSTVTFDLEVTNTGDTSLGSVVVTDAMCDTLTFDGGDTNNNSILEIDETWNYTCTVNNVTADFTNVASVTGNPVDENGDDIPDLEDPEAEDEADVDVLPDVTLTKESADLVFLGGDQYEITYTITIQNDGAATDYDLDDALTFGPGITPSTVTVTNTTPGTIVTNPAFDGVGTQNIVTAEALAAVTTHTYQVVVAATVDPADLTMTGGDCTLDGGEAGTGFLNTATLTVEGDEQEDDACEELPEADLGITKTVASGPTLNLDGTYTISYTVTVTNTGDGPTLYDLEDEFQFGAGMTMVSGAVANTVPGTITTIAAFDGTANTDVVLDEPLVGGGTHAYTVTAVVDAVNLESTTDGDCTLGAGETGTGFLNEATVSNDTETETADACEEVPPADINLTKVVSTGPTLEADGSYTVVYEVEVTNVGQGPGNYDLDDSFNFGAGVTVVTAGVANTAPGTIVTDPGFDGAATPSIVAGEPIASGDTHTYEITVNATVAGDMTADERDCTVAGGETGTGFLNEATITVDGAEEDADACVEVPPANLTITKSITDGPTVAPNGDYTITYEVVVTNTGQGPGEYDLDDELTFGAGITIATANVSNTAPGTITTIAGWDGVGTVDVVDGESIDPADAHTYEVVVTGSTNGLVDEAAGDCTLDQGETGTGFLNTATLDFDGTETEVEACEPEPDPMLTIVKTVATGPTLGADGNYTVTYDVVVTNVGGADTYDLTDDLNFGAGITVVSASVANVTPGTITTNPNWDGVGDNAVVTGELITAGSTHGYLVTVVADALLVADEAAGDCDLAGGETGTGFLNVAEITTDDGTMEAEDCVEVPDPALELTKTVASGPTLEADGSYTISYTIVVQNTGDGPGNYDLDDEMTFGAGMTVNSATVTNLVPGTITTDPTWDGVGNNDVVTGEPIAAQSSHSYTVTANVDALNIASSTAADCVLDQGETGTGFLNTATLESAAGELEDDACEELPPPNISLTKILTTGPIDLGNGQYSLVYELAVTNTGQGPGSYDLDDELLFGTGITVDTAALQNPSPATLPVSGTWDGTGNNDVLIGQAIGAGETHTVEVAVTATVAPGTLTGARDCVLDQGETGTGFLNEATLDVEGEVTEDDACAEAPPADLTIDKAVTTGPTSLGGDQFEMVYTITVTNLGQGPGEYDLDDALTFGAGVTVDSAAVANTAPGTITTDPLWDGEGNNDVVDNAAIQGGETHTYEVTVTSTVDGAVTTLADGDCTLDANEAGTGFLNTATMTFESTDTEDDACEPVPGPELTLEKALTTGPTLNADGSFTIEYEITVTNDGEGPGAYDLNDELMFAAGSTILSASIANTTPGTITTDPAWDGEGNTAVVTGEAINGGDSHVYLVEVTTDVALSITNDERDCSLAVTETGTGFMNTATVDSEAGTLEDDACGEIPPADITIDKSTLGAPIIDGNGVTIGYEITVTNDGDGPGTYDLDDALTFGAGITVDTATVSNVLPGTVTTNPAWDGVGDTAVATSVGLAAGETHTFEVFVDATIDAASIAGGAGDCVVDPGEAGTGLLNTATVTSENGTDEADACEEIPGPVFEIAKTVTSGPTATGTDHEYEIVYEITVTNVGDGPGIYTLIDEYAFAAGTQVVSSAVTNTAPGTVTTNSAFDGDADPFIASDELVIGEAHTFDVTVVANVSGVHDAAALDCVVDPGEGGTGFLNVAIVDPDGGALEAEDCVEIPPIADLELVKVANVTEASVGDTIIWTITVENKGPVGTTGVTVTDDLPAGVEFVSSDGDYDAATGLWTIGDLAFGETATLNITGTVIDITDLANVAEVTASDVPDPDSTPANADPDEDDQDEVIIQGQSGGVSGTIWFDADMDGVIDPGETLLPGVTVILLDEDGNVIGTTTTGPNGEYDFTGLPPGDYTVRVDPGTLPADLDLSTYEKDGVFDFEFTFTLGPGETESDVDFGYAITPGPVLPRTGAESKSLALFGALTLLLGALVLGITGRRRQTGA